MDGLKSIPTIYFVPPELFVSSTKKSHNIVISTKEKSSQVTPQRKFNLSRASRGDFSFVEMTNGMKFYTFL